MAVTPDPTPSVSEVLATDAASAQFTGTPAHSAGNTHCLNCATPLTGPYCHACGQHDFDINRSFWHTFLEALENIFHFDGKFFRNIITLLFSPGRLTADFLAGRRASQVPPFRLYIFTAFIFFLLLLAGNRGKDGAQFSPIINDAAPAGLRSGGQPAALEEALTAVRDPVAAQNIRDQIAARPKKAAASKPAVPEEKSSFETWAEDQGQRAMKPEFQREIGARFLTAVPKMLLFCLPIFALLTRFLFRKSGNVFLEHLVIALHFHTFIFLFVLFRDGWSFVLSSVGLLTVRGAFSFVCNLWLFLYPILLLRRLFANSWRLTIAKSALLGLGYGLTLLIGFSITALILLVAS